MKSVEKSAKTQEEAIQAALDELNVSITDVDIKVLDEGSKGLFGLFGSKPARVLVTLKSSEIEDELDSLLQSAPKKAPAQSVPSPAPERKVESPAERPVQAAAPSAPAEEPQPEAKPAARKPEPVRRTRPQPKKEKPAASKPAAEAAPAESKQPVQRPAVLLEKPEVTMLAPDAVDPESAAGKALSFLEELTRLMGVSVTVSVGTDAEGNVYGRMEGDTLGVLIGRRGETLDALQYLTSLKVNRGQETYTRVTLDTEDYRSRREETLIRLANRMANRAVRTNRRVSLEPMNPYERRIIHSALQGNEAVDTHSEGDEPNRHVVITIKK
ncbi:MAG: Jag N-terminal domain-containing protein [Clostridiales bacterium]|nr:Jag N-terminal domain-containing protein [Clostridiales bacterium]